MTFGGAVSGVLSYTLRTCSCSGSPRVALKGLSLLWTVDAAEADLFAFEESFQTCLLCSFSGMQSVQNSGKVSPISCKDAIPHAFIASHEFWVWIKYKRGSKVVRNSVDHPNALIVFLVLASEFHVLGKDRVVA